MDTAKIMLSDGEVFDILHPDPEQIRLGPIAKSLSMQCRWTGHSLLYYSVAEHCVLVSKLVPPRLALWGLLHDASEAFVGDMASPLKQAIPQYRTIEGYVEHAVMKAFGIWKHGWSGVDAALVKEADQKAAAIEVHYLMPEHETHWDVLPMFQAPPWALGWKPHRAESEYLRRFGELTSEA